MERREADVVVVGGGLAGLAAARAVLATGQEPLVLEARGRVGGRVENLAFSDGTLVEIGGQWLGPTQDHGIALAAELGLETHQTHNAGHHIFEQRGRLRRHRSTIPRLGPVALADMLQIQLRLERMARRIPLEAPWTADDAERLDELTVAAWMRRASWTRNGRMLATLACEAVWAADPADVSLLHFLFYARSGGSLDRLISTIGGAQDRRVVGGTGLLATGLAGLVGHDRVLLDAPVRRLVQSAGGVEAFADGVVVGARRAIVAVPPALAGRIAYDPPLPGDRDQLTQRMPMGSVIKCLAAYPEPFWRAEGLSGQATGETGPVKVVFDNSPPGGRPGVLMGFLEGSQARLFARAPAHERRAAVLACFARYFGPRAADPDEYVDRDWSAEEWTRGCYGAFLPPGTWTAFGHALRRPAGRIHWAGTETSLQWCGYMDGALRSGERAATEVLEAESASRRSAAAAAA